MAKPLSNARFDALAQDYDALYDADDFAAFAASCITTQPWFLPSMGRGLDVGCGTGTLTFQLRERLSSVVGLDPSAGMLQVFEHKIAEAGLGDVVSTCEANLLDEAAPLPPALRPASFDLIFSQLAFHHLRDGRSMVRALAPLLAPGGRLLIADFEATSNARLFHPTAMRLGVDYEHDGISEQQALGWFAKLSFETPTIARFPFEMLPAEGHAGVDSTAKQTFQLLLVSASRSGQSAKL